MHAQVFDVQKSGRTRLEVVDPIQHGWFWYWSTDPVNYVVEVESQSNDSFGKSPIVPKM